MLGQPKCFSTARREEEHRGSLGWQSLLLPANGVGSHRERHRAQTEEAMTWVLQEKAKRSSVITTTVSLTHLESKILLAALLPVGLWLLMAMDSCGPAIPVHRAVEHTSLCSLLGLNHHPWSHGWGIVCIHACLPYSNKMLQFRAVMSSWCVSFKAATYILDDPRALEKINFLMLY